MPIQKVCKLCGIEYEVSRPSRRPKGRPLYCSSKCARQARRKFDYNEAKALYQEGWSLGKIAERFEVAPSTVSLAFKREGVPKRSRSESLFQRWKGKEPTKENLWRLYWDENKSTPEVARMYGLTATAIVSKLHRYGIPIKHPTASHLQVKVIRESDIPIRSLVVENMLISYVLTHKDEFGYKEVYVYRNKDFDLLCVSQSGALERVEIEREAVESLRHDHNLQNIDRVIAYYGDGRALPFPVTFVDKAKFVGFAENIRRLAREAQV